MDKKNRSKKQNIVMIMLVAITVLIVFILKNPYVMGDAVSNKESIYSENLNIEKNESGTYDWNVKNPGSIKSLKVSGSVTSNGTAKVYIEKNGTKYLLFDSTKQLFDVNINVLPEYKKISQGDEMLVQITLLNLRGFGSGNVDVKYSIKDPKGNLVASEEEIVFVETQAKFIRKLLIPAEMGAGTYFAHVEASANSTIIGSGSDSFEVMSKYKYAYPHGLKYYIIGIVALIILVIISMLGIDRFKKLSKRKDIAAIKEKEPLEKIAKLEKELKALEEARKAGFISDESYQKEKKRIEEKLGAGKK